ncbi:MAG TPA: hypothetical protein VGV65_11900 [Nocardioides sp.]|nr:hypothetical protein [Nocardioides sp.]
MRTALLVLSLALLSATSACTSSATGGADVSARDREKLVVDAVAEAVPLVEQALGATRVKVGGGWSSCPGGVGHVYSGGGTISAPEGDPDVQLDAVRTALTDAGFEEGTLVEGHVSVSRDEVGMDFAPSAARGAGAWAVSFKGPCKRYGGDDEQYVQDQNLEGERTLLP